MTSYHFDSGLVLVDERAGRLFAYNESAAVVWRALAGGDDPAQALQDTYGIPRQLANRDAAAIVDGWRSAGLLAGGPARAQNGRGSEAGPATESAPQTRTVRAVYDIGGRSFRIAVADDEIARRVETLFRPFRVEGDAADDTIDVCRLADGRTLIVSRNDVELYRVTSVAEVTGALFQTILSSIYSGEQWLAIIHGGAVATDGRAVLLPGTSGSGKSTLGAFLFSRGFDCLCDDMLAVTHQGCVASWPIPLSIKEGSWPALAPCFPELDAIPGESVWGRTMKFLPVGPASWRSQLHRAAVLVFPTFDRGAGQARITRLRPLETLRRLVSDRIWLGYPLRASSVERFLPWVGSIPSYELSYSSLEQAAELVHEAVARG